MNRRGASVVTYLTLMGVFVAFWAFGFSTMLSAIGQQAVVGNSMTGFEAFIFANLNLVIFFCVVVGTAAAVYVVGGNSQ